MWAAKKPTRRKGWFEKVQPIEEVKAKQLQTEGLDLRRFKHNMNPIRRRGKEWPDQGAKMRPW